MMARTKSQFICQQCGASYPKWTGKCDNCGEWNALVEQAPVETGANAVARSHGRGAALKGLRLGEAAAEAVARRLSTGIGDLDAVLGGGFLPGGVVLVAGQPGIGKSTLLAQVSAFVGRDHQVLYVSGEESVSQIQLRAERLGAAKSKGLQLASSSSAEDIAASIQTGQYDLVVVDSIQTLSLAEVSSAPGSVSQITNSSNAIIRAAKAAGAAVILVGHVTKEGSIAGPKVLEHLVDVVLNFEGDRYGGFRVVRAQKNRYGSTTEAAIFEMNQDGLKIVTNPSAALLAERQNLDGSIVLATLEGARPLEISFSLK